LISPSWVRRRPPHPERINQVETLGRTTVANQHGRANPQARTIHAENYRSEHQTPHRSMIGSARCPQAPFFNRSTDMQTAPCNPWIPMSRKQVPLSQARTRFLRWLLSINTPRIFAHLELPAGCRSRLAFVVHCSCCPADAPCRIVAPRREAFSQTHRRTRTPANHGLEINLRYNIQYAGAVALAAIAWSGVALSSRRIGFS